MAAATTTATTWVEGREQALQKCILPMSDKSHKGSSGRVGVLGGSARYTGAPYYAAMASLKVGADLAYVFCAEEAAMAIKCYSPELMVAPVYCATEFDALAAEENGNEKVDLAIDKMVKEVVSMMDRMHVLVVGPGLGRCPVVMRATTKIIKEAMSRNLAMVLDADALFLLTLEPKLLNGYHNVVLTPNVMEYKRLVEANVLSDKSADSTLGGAIVVQKGRHDLVSTTRDGERCEMVCKEKGGLKRSGGLGDLLAGTLGTFVAWDQILDKRGEPHDLFLGCWSACCVVKRGTKRAFHEKRRAMTAPDVLDVIGETVDEMTNY